MIRRQFTIAAAAGLVALAVFAAPAQALECPARPDTQDTNHVQNNQERATCLANQLGTTIDRIELKRQFDVLDTRLQSLELQRRFDTLPRVQPF